MASGLVLAVVLVPTIARAEPPAGDGASLSQRSSVGARLGPIASWINRDRGPIEDDVYDRFKQYGLAAGVVAQLELAPPISIEAGLSYLPKGERSVLMSNGRERELHMDYLSASLVGSLRLFEYRRVTPYLLGGAALGGLVRCRDIDSGGTGGCSSFIETWDVGVVVGIGAALDLSGPGSIAFEAGYEHGMRRIDAVDGYDHRNRAMLFSIRYSHHLGEH